MTQTPQTPLDPQRIQLNAALSDPEGWGVHLAGVGKHPTGAGLVHRSGLLLGLGAYKEDDEEDDDVYHTEIYMPHTIEDLQWSTSSLSADDVPPGIFVPSTTIQKIQICRYYSEDILNAFPGQIPTNLDMCAEALCVFQQILRLNCTQAGMALVLRTRQDVAAHILHAIPEATGTWQVDFSTKEAYARAYTPTHPSYCKFPKSLSDALLAVGLPVQPHVRSKSVKFSPSIHIEMPSTAHARANLLRRF